MKKLLKAGTTSYLDEIVFRSSTTGQIVTSSVAYSAVTYKYVINGAAAGISGSCATMTAGTWATAGFVQVLDGSSAITGVCQIGVPNAAIAGGPGINGVRLTYSSTGCIDVVVEYEFEPAVNTTQIAGQTASASGGVTFPASIGTSTLTQTQVTGGAYDVTNSGVLIHLASAQKVDVDTIKTNPVVNGGTVTFPTGATLASTTNITAGTISTVTTLTNLPAVTTDWLTAAGVKADAVTKIQTGLATPTNITAATGVALAASQHVIVDSGTVTTVTNQLTAAAIATGVWQDTTAGDFTAALSIGKSIMNGVSLGTGLKIAEAVLVDTTTTLTNPGGDTSGTATLLSRLSSTRAGYLDNLSGGAVATNAQVAALMFGSPNFAVPQEIIVPASSTIPVVIYLYIYADDNTLVDADSTPTFALHNAAGTDLSARLGSVTHISTGKYKLTYTSTSTDAMGDPLIFEADYTVATKATAKIMPSLTVDFIADYFNSTDRSKLVSIYNVIPANTPLVNSSGYATSLLTGDLTATMKTSVTTAATAATPTATLTSAYDAAKTAAQAGNKMDLVDAPNSTALAAIKTALGTMAVNLIQILGTGFTENTTGWIAAAFKKFFNIGSSALTTASANQTGDAYGVVDDGTVGNTALLAAIESGGGAGLTKQDVADSLKLAPSAGLVASGSVMQLLSAGAIVFTGANPVTITVTDQYSNPIPNALVRITLGGLTQLQQTNASGIAQTSAGVLPALNNGTYSLFVTCGFAYVGITQLFVVSGTSSTVVVLQSQSVPSPLPNQCIGTILTVDINGNPQASQRVSLWLLNEDQRGLAGDGATKIYTSDSGGVITDNFLANATYRIQRGQGVSVQYKTPAAGQSFLWESVVG